MNTPSTPEPPESAEASCSTLSAILNASYRGCQNGCLHCGEINEIASDPITEIGQIGSSSVVRCLQLEEAIVNIFRWTGSRRVARECRRVLPDVAERAEKSNNKVSDSR